MPFCSYVILILLVSLSCFISFSCAAVSFTSVGTNRLIVMFCARALIRRLPFYLFVCSLPFLIYSSGFCAKHSVDLCRQFKHPVTVASSNHYTETELLTITTTATAKDC